MALSNEQIEFRRTVVQALAKAELSFRPSAIVKMAGLGHDAKAWSRYAKFKKQLYGSSEDVDKLVAWLKMNGFWQKVDDLCEKQNLPAPTPFDAVLIPKLTLALRRLADALDDPNIPLDTKARWLRQEIEFLARALPDDSIERVVQQRTESGQQIVPPGKPTGQKE